MDAIISRERQKVEQGHQVELLYKPMHSILIAAQCCAAHGGYHEYPGDDQTEADFLGALQKLIVERLDSIKSDERTRP